MQSETRERLFWTGLILLFFCCVWSPICYHLYMNNLTIFEPLKHFVLIGFVFTFAAGALTMFGRGWMRLPFAISTIFVLVFWFGFSILAGW
jgi:hypothetical protein